MEGVSRGHRPRDFKGKIKVCSLFLMQWEATRDYISRIFGRKYIVPQTVFNSKELDEGIFLEVWKV